MRRLRHCCARSASFTASTPPMLPKPSFFKLIVQPSPSRNSSSATDRGERSPYPRLPLHHEPAVLGEAGGVEEQRDAVLVTERPRRPHILHRHRLATARVVGD